MHTEQQRWLIGNVWIPVVFGIFSTVGIVVAIIVGVRGCQHDDQELAQANQQARREVEDRRTDQVDRARAEAAERPILRVQSSRFENGYSLITVAHSSRTRHANVHGAVFRISDPQQLRRIRSIVPEVYPPGYGAANPRDDVFFKKGAWVGGEFVFGANLGLNIPPGPASDIRLAILDPRFAGMALSGELEIDYSAGTDFIPPLVLKNLTINGRRP